MAAARPPQVPHDPLPESGAVFLRWRRSRENAPALPCIALKPLPVCSLAAFQKSSPQPRTSLRAVLPSKNAAMVEYGIRCHERKPATVSASLLSPTLATQAITAPVNATGSTASNPATNVRTGARKRLFMPENLYEDQSYNIAVGGLRWEIYLLIHITRKNTKTDEHIGRSRLQ